jgi:Ca2+-binding EF-hand superfamily protein
MPVANTEPAARLTSLAAPTAIRNIARQLLLRYDDNRDGSLSIGELGLAQGDAGRFDHDRSGGLDLEETVAMLRRPVAALDLQCHWNAEGSRQRRTIALGSQSVVVELSAGSPDFDPRVVDELFARLDSDRNQYLEPAEADQSPQVKRALHVIDLDGDDKIMPQELHDYAQCVALLAPRQLVASYQGQSQSLFETIDVNRDTKLSPLELAAFSARIPKWDADGNGAVTAADVSSTARLTIGPAVSWTVRQEDAAASPSLRHPIWFTRMDRNQDGVVSHREFLGPPPAFLAIDADDNGFLDPAEATVAGGLAR